MFTDSNVDAGPDDRQQQRKTCFAHNTFSHKLRYKCTLYIKSR